MLSATAAELLNCLIFVLSRFAWSVVRKAFGSFWAMRRRNEAPLCSTLAVSLRFDAGWSEVDAGVAVAVVLLSALVLDGVTDVLLPISPSSSFLAPFVFVGLSSSSLSECEYWNSLSDAMTGCFLVPRK